MTAHGAARRCQSGSAGPATLLWLILTCAAAPAAAQPEAAGLLVVRGPSTQGAVLRRQLSEAFGPLTRDAEAFIEAQSLPPPPRALAPLRSVERLLGRARQQAANLAERDALSTLAQAERLMAQLPALEGAAAWSAEVQVQLGIVAAQAGLHALAEQALRRAVLFDPQRQLGEAEAAPDTVLLASRLRAEVAAAPRGTFTLTSEPAGARVHWDDAPLGVTPLSLTAPVGRHLLRLSAPGHQAVGVFVEVFEGARAPLHVALARSPRSISARRLVVAARAADYAGIVVSLRHLARHGAAPKVLVVETGSQPRRALLVHCSPSGCRGPSRLQVGSGRLDLSSRLISAVELSQARGFLAAERRPRADRSPALWERWYVWSGVLAAAAAVGVTAALLEAQEPERRLRLVVDPSGVGQ